MRILVTGVAGQLGHDVVNELYKRGIPAVGSDIAPLYGGTQDGSAVTTVPYMQMDITNAEMVDRVLTAIHPDVVIHCAAWTAVDLAEEPERYAQVRAINVESNHASSWVNFATEIFQSPLGHHQRMRFEQAGLSFYQPSG